MMEVAYKTDLHGVDWAEMKQTLSQDKFDNGRTAGQLRCSFENSHSYCLAYVEGRIVGTVRVLSDGVCNAYVVDVWTLSTFRKLGIATRMMEIVVSKLNGQHVHLFSDLPDVYESMGFKRHDVGLAKVIGKWLQNETLALSV